MNSYVGKIALTAFAGVLAMGAVTANAQILGARPGYNSVLMKQEAKRQQFQANLRAAQIQQLNQAKISGATAKDHVQ